MRNPSDHSKVAMTVAGSDSGGGAGVQADLKVFHSVGVWGTCAITCLTAQNPSRVSRVEAASPRMVVEQMKRVMEVFAVSAAKTGMLYDEGIIEVVARIFRQRKFRSLVVDPVMVATSGARLLKPEAVVALRECLLPLALLVTPNRAEAEVLWGRPIRTRDEQRAAAKGLSERFGVAFLVKGGHFLEAVDVLSDGTEFAAPRVRGVKTHGTGCVLSAAITAHLALGHSLVESVARAKQLVTEAIAHPLRIGRFRALRV